MDENPTQPINDTPDEQQVTPENARDAAKAAANALVEAQFPDTKEPEPEQVKEVQEAPTETEAPSGQPETTAPPEESTPEATTTPNVAPASEPDDEEEYVAQTPAPTVAPLDAKNFVDENGYVDVNKLTEAINQSVSQAQQSASVIAQREVNAHRQEERQWNQAVEKYPQLKTDRGLRDLVQQARIGQTTELYQRAGNDPQRLASIKIPTPTQIAGELFKRLGEAKTQGVKDATESVKIQQTAYQETASTPGDSTAETKRSELFNEIRNPDPIRANDAQRTLLKDLLFSEE